MSLILSVNFVIFQRFQSVNKRARMNRTPRRSYFKFYVILTSFFLGCAQKTVIDNNSLFMTPSAKGHRIFIEQIDQAQTSIQLKMFHLSDQEVVGALINAHLRGIKIQILLDRSGLNSPRFKNYAEQLLRNHIQVRPGSYGFSITHEKSMIIDQHQALITTINLTNQFESTRDYGLFVTDPNVIEEMQKVFVTDWQNSQNNENYTPELKQPNLLWSPVNAREKLVALIDSAQFSLQLEVENLGDEEIIQALEKAAARSVEVKVITPQCDKNKNPFYNYPALSRLQRAKVETRVMPFPASADKPYMHAKMILADHQKFYLGSVNFSFNSLSKARELGIILTHSKNARELDMAFETDWSVSEVSFQPGPGFCPAYKE